MTPYPPELRQRVVNAYQSGEGTQEEIAERFSICRGTLVQWLRLKMSTGSLEPLAPGGGNCSSVDMNILRAVIAERPDATSFEITANYNRRVKRKSRVHRSSILRAFDRAGFVFKKNASVLWSKTDPMSS
jgi:transposase